MTTTQITTQTTTQATPRTASTTSGLPGLVAGTWTIDSSHSHVGFTVRHLMVSKVRGEFSRFEGTIEITEDVLDSTVEASIDVASVNTRDDGRDNHLRASDFFAVDEHPTWTFRSTELRATGAGDDNYTLVGDLTLRGVTRSVDFDLEVHGVQKDPWGGTRIGFSAATLVNRKDFGIDWNAPVDGGGVVVGDKVTITLEIEAVLQER
jgi:polyisoprenoid-binding protein YceI